MSRESVQSLNDEKLMAYVNGVLTESERIEVEEALGIDHEFRVKLEEISQAVERVDDILRNVREDGQPYEVAAVNDQSEPGESTQVRVVEADSPSSVEPGRVAQSSSAESGATPPVVVAEAETAGPEPLRSETDREPVIEQPTPVIPEAADHGAVVDSRRGAGWLGRVAVVMAIFAAGAGGYYYGHVVQPSAARMSSAVVESASPLSQALQKTPSQELFRFADGGDIVLPTLSFKTADGRYCRQFEINSGQTVSLGVACNQSGEWRMEMFLAAGERQMGSAVFQPVSNRHRDAMSALFDRLWGGSHLDSVEERAAIARGWSSMVSQ